MDLLRVISNYALLGLGLLVFLAAWGFSVLLVYGRAARFAQPGLERYFWPALAVILPLVGALLFPLSRLAERILFAGSREPAPRSDPTSTALPGPAAAVNPVPAPIQAGAATLTGLSGPFLGRLVSLQALPLTVGRGPGVGLSLDDDRRVSRQHAVLYWHNGAVWLRDTGSLHGTQVNGRAVTDQAIKDGDRLQFGESEFVFRVS